MVPSAVVREGDRGARVERKWEERLGGEREGERVDDKERMKAPKQPYRILSVSRNGGGRVVAMPVFKGLE